jgi:hypothetical protein
MRGQSDEAGKLKDVLRAVARIMSGPSSREQEDLTVTLGAIDKIMTKGFDKARQEVSRILTEQQPEDAFRSIHRLYMDGSWRPNAGSGPL